MNTRPEISEYNPFYETYIKKIPEGDISQILNEQCEKTAATLKELSEKQALFRYRPDKWSIKEVMGHVTDTERIMSYRLLSIARGETVSLPGFDQNAYVENASFDKMSLEDILAHFIAVRNATVLLLKSLSDTDWLKSGFANEAKVTVRALAYIIAGHERHHFELINERYLKSANFPAK